MTHPALASLQQVDSELDAARKRLAELDALAADHSAISTAMAAAQAADADATAKRARLRDRELELKTLEARMTELERRLYGGRVQNTKELENLDRELKMFRENQGRLEENILQWLEESESADAGALAAKQQLEIAQTERERAEALWKGERESLLARQTALSAKATALREQADGDQLAAYDRVRRRNTLAVTIVHGGQCGVCGITLPVATIDRAREPQTLAQCDNCSRILCVAES